MELKTSLTENIIKVIGVGSGGARSVNHMIEQGIHGDDYAVCNISSHRFCGIYVPTKIDLITYGSIMYSIIDVTNAAKEFFDNGTKNSFCCWRDERAYRFCYVTDSCKKN